MLHLTSKSEDFVLKEEKKQKRFTDSVLSTMAALCQMDPSLQSNVSSSRIVMVSMKLKCGIFKMQYHHFPFQFFIFLAFSLLYAAYTANIVSLLQSPSKSLRNMRDLYYSKLEFGVEDTPYNRYYLAASNQPFERKFFLEKLAPPGKKDHFVKAQEGAARVRKGLYAFMAEETGVYKIMEDSFYEHEKCELVNIEFLKFSDPFLSIKKRSPYKEIVRVK